jgi:Fe-S-cluster containining protein
MHSTEDMPTVDHAGDIEMLERLFNAYDSWTGQYQFACHQGCVACCTQSVTMTTLEGERIIEYLRENGQLDGLGPLLAAGRPTRRPVQTTNQFAADCLAQEEPLPEEGEWDFTPCIFLERKLCTIYPVRPFGCRSFSSTVDCDAHGCAEVAPVVITVNTVVLQIIEHLNSWGGFWGNMMDILSYLLAGKERALEAHLLPAQPNPGFLIPQEEMQEVAAFFARINGPNMQGENLAGVLRESVRSAE